MKISFITNAGNMNLNTGFGIAGFNVVRSLQKLGHEVPFASPDAPIEIAFCQPDFSEWSNPDAYHIQYTPWESTHLKEGWLEAFNENCDEVWTTSPLIAEWYKQAGIIKPIYTYKHGVEADIYPSRKRERGEVLRFLHVGEPAVRKGGQMAFEAFMDTFGNRTDVHLTIKAWMRSEIRQYGKGGSIKGLPQQNKNVSMIYNDYSREQMSTLYNQQDALLYPSWGEGFGFIPLEAAATGMPVIVPESWPPYSNLIPSALRIASDLVPSPWPDTHPGVMYKPDYNDLCRAMRELDENFNVIAGQSYRYSYHLKQEYDWLKLTEDAFDHVLKLISD